MSLERSEPLISIHVFTIFVSSSVQEPLMSRSYEGQVMVDHLFAVMHMRGEATERSQLPVQLGGVGPGSGRGRPRKNTVNPPSGATTPGS